MRVHDTFVSWSNKVSWFAYLIWFDHKKNWFIWNDAIISSEEMLAKICIVLNVWICEELYFADTCSLEGRFEDDEMQQVLDDIKTKRSFQCWTIDAKSAGNFCSIVIMIKHCLSSWSFYFWHCWENFLKLVYIIHRKIHDNISYTPDKL